jgi:hypothetical protein
LLHRALDYSKLIEIQEIIMDAIGDGMAISAKDSFDKHKVSFSSGETSMGSDEMIAYMTNLLVADSQFDTALMFLEKLGLAETYVKYTSSQIDMDKLKTLTDETYKISEDFKKFQAAIKPHIDYIQAELKQNKGNYMQGLENLSDAIVDNSDAYNIGQDDQLTLLAAIETIKYNLKNSKKSQNELIFNSIMNSAQQNLANNIQEIIEEKDARLTSAATIVDLINQVMLPSGSEADTARTKLNEEFSKLCEYRKNLFNLQDDTNSDKI